MVVVGVALDYCIKATVLDSLREGYDTYLIVDAVRAVDESEGGLGQALRLGARRFRGSLWAARRHGSGAWHRAERGTAQNTKVSPARGRLRRRAWGALWLAGAIHMGAGCGAWSVEFPPGSFHFSQLCLAAHRTGRRVLKALERKGAKLVYLKDAVGGPLVGARQGE